MTITACSTAMEMMPAYTSSASGRTRTPSPYRFPALDIAGMDDSMDDGMDDGARVYCEGRAEISFSRLGVCLPRAPVLALEPAESQENWELRAPSPPPPPAWIDEDIFLGAGGAGPPPAPAWVDENINVPMSGSQDGTDDADQPVQTEVFTSEEGTLYKTAIPKSFRGPGSASDLLGFETTDLQTSLKRKNRR